MKTIYQRAGLVIIWLGEELTTDPEALRLAIDIRTFINGNQEVPVDIFGTIDHEASGIPRAGSPSWRSLMLLYGRLWFQRVWIVQEFIFGKTCVMWCGTLEFDPEILMQPARRFSAYRQLAKIIASLNSDGTAQYTNRIREMASLWLLKEIIGQGKPQGLRLMGLLWQTLAFQATDPRDKVFCAGWPFARRRSRFH